MYCDKLVIATLTSANTLPEVRGDVDVKALEAAGLTYVLPCQHAENALVQRSDVEGEPVGALANGDRGGGSRLGHGVVSSGRCKYLWSLSAWWCSFSPHSQLVRAACPPRGAGEPGGGTSLDPVRCSGSETGYPRSIGR
ncbi:hypothetical protein SAMN05421507_1011432 [Lentzea jiangxiensis]|uniref:Uncharacterized protein n=1 Tax=Lentzea jiangxiensis TaxID=641025 RepID=A0A1H0GZ70_9PSEU|nr:hypothetical protein SAMN05421507_1011432 [Lentzea jiangxiensis]